jgi:hypothetical protein
MKQSAWAISEGTVLFLLHSGLTTSDRLCFRSLNCVSCMFYLAGNLGGGCVAGNVIVNINKHHGEALRGCGLTKT